MIGSIKYFKTLIIEDRTNMKFSTFLFPRQVVILCPTVNHEIGKVRTNYAGSLEVVSVCKVYSRYRPRLHGILYGLSKIKCLCTAYICWVP